MRGQARKLANGPDVQFVGVFCHRLKPLFFGSTIGVRPPEADKIRLRIWP